MLIPDSECFLSFSYSLWVCPLLFSSHVCYIHVCRGPDGETMPFAVYDDDTQQSNNRVHTRAQDTASTTSSNPLPLTFHRGTPLFDVYWHGRIIPLAHIDSLFFMLPIPQDSKQCEQRIKGFIYLSYPFLANKSKVY